MKINLKKTKVMHMSTLSRKLERRWNKTRISAAIGLSWKYGNRELSMYYRGPTVDGGSLWGRRHSATERNLCVGV